MALRNIRTIGDEILRKEAKSVKAMTPRTEKLIEVGILKRIVVIDVSENQDAPYVLINPEIIETSGSQTGSEGCLSVPGKHATVTRPDYAKVRAQDENMEWFELEGEGLLARAICHECDHLDGILYVDKKEGPLLDNEEPQEEEE